MSNNELPGRAVGKLLGGFPAQWKGAPEGAAYKVLEALEPKTWAPTGRFYLAHGADVVLLPIFTDNGTQLHEFPNNMEMFLPQRVAEPVT